MTSKPSFGGPTARRWKPGSSVRSVPPKGGARRPRCALKRDRERDAMRRALELAWRGWGRVSPNPLVGVVGLRGEDVVAGGWAAEFGGPAAGLHAPHAAGHQAGRRAPGRTPEAPRA